MVDFPPPDSVTAAAAAGWPACGIWFDPETWSQGVERATLQRAQDKGITILDVEPIIVGVDPDVTEPLIDAAAALDARFVLFTSRVGDWRLVVDRFARACDVAAQAAPGLTVVYEFLPAFAIGTLGAALRLVAEAGRSNGAVLVDNLHLARSGAHPRDLRNVDPKLLPYLQLADAPLRPPVGNEALLHEARHERLWPGEGVLPIPELLDVVPDVPLSFEVRSAALRHSFPDPVGRAEYAWSRVQHLCTAD